MGFYRLQPYNDLPPLTALVNGVVIYTAPRGHGVLEDKLQQLEAFSSKLFIPLRPPMAA
jgi:hypothetical protein